MVRYIFGKLLSKLIAIWQVGKGDGVYLGILNYDGRIKDWEFFNKWIKSNNDIKILGD